jgi:hypothetical protein
MLPFHYLKSINMQLPKMLFVLGVGASATTAASAQSIGPSAMTAAGGSAAIPGGFHEYAIGQLTSANAYTSASLIVTPGVLQPEFATTGVAMHSLKAAAVSVYPNPVVTTLFLQPDLKGAGTLSYKLHDAAGRLVLQSTASLVTGGELQRIQMATLAAGQYTLQVEWLQGGQVSSSAFQIQKLK